MLSNRRMQNWKWRARKKISKKIKSHLKLIWWINCALILSFWHHTILSPRFFVYIWTAAIAFSYILNFFELNLCRSLLFAKNIKEKYIFCCTFVSYWYWWSYSYYYYLVLFKSYVFFAKHVHFCIACGFYASLSRKKNKNTEKNRKKRMNFLERRRVCFIYEIAFTHELCALCTLMHISLKRNKKKLLLSIFFCCGFSFVWSHWLVWVGWYCYELLLNVFRFKYFHYILIHLYLLLCFNLKCRIFQGLTAELKN